MKKGLVVLLLCVSCCFAVSNQYSAKNILKDLEDLKDRSTHTDNAESFADVSNQRFDLNSIKNRWKNFKLNFKASVSSLFPSKEFWDNSFLFRIPAKFKNWTLESFAKINGAIVSERDIASVTRSQSRPRGSSGSFLEVSEDDGLPESYQFIQKYPHCLMEEFEQGRCGSCWAVSIASSLGHRLCKMATDAGKKSFLKGNGFKDRVSPQLLVSCAGDDVSSAADGCRGGVVSKGINMMTSAKKINLGKVGCQPYYSYQGENFPRACAGLKDNCEKQTPIWQNRIVGGPARRVVGETEIKKAIMEFGPMPIVVLTPSNFIGASGVGVFARGDAPFLPKGTLNYAHAMVIHGWGKDSQTGQPFWTIENSWGAVYKKNEFGNRGFINVVRGLPTDMGIETIYQYDTVPMFRKDDGNVVPLSEVW